MLVSNKHFVPVIGLDIHIVILFGFPIPLPHPYIGFVLDPMDYIPFIGATTKVNSVPRGKSDTSGIYIILFHIPMGGPFLLAPMIGHDSVNFFGSQRVKVEGNMMSPSGHMLMTCNDIGIPLSLQPGKKLKPIPSMYLPTSFSIPLSFGKPVMVGGPFVPDWAGALLNLVMSFGFGALMKGLGKAGKKAMTKFNHALKGKIGSNKLSKFLCKKGFEPVDLVQGIVIYDGCDFELPGPIPLRWTRSYNSDSRHEGLLGVGTHLRYDMRIYEFTSEGATAVLLGDGRSAMFDLLPYTGDSEYNRHERLTLKRTDLNEYVMYDHNERLYYTFTNTKLSSIHNKAGFIITFHYNTRGALVRVIDSVGRHLIIMNDDQGRIVQVTARHRGEERLLVSYQYNEAGDLEAIADALGQTNHIVYRDHLMVSKQDRNGYTFYWEYDNKGRCVHTRGEDGLLEGHISYHPKEGYNLVTNSLGATTTYYYTPDFVVHQVKDPLGHSTFTEYTPDFEVYRQIDEEANMTGYSYDELGNCIAVVKPDGATFNFGYDAEGRLILAGDAMGGSHIYTYFDDTGLLHTISESDGSTKAFVYNEQLLVTKIEDTADEVTLLEYDADKNLVGLQLPNGTRTTWEYDAWGLCINNTNPEGNRQSYQYDELGRLVSVTTADNNQIRLQYNEYDEVLKATDKYSEVQYTYTPLGNVKTKEENGRKLHFIYNNEEQLTGVVNERGERYTYLRNNRGDVITEKGFDGVTYHYERDGTGKTIKMHLPGNKVAVYEYNNRNQLTRSEHEDGSWETFSYDRNGRLTEAVNEYATIRLQRDIMGRVTREWQNGHVVNTAYYRDGRKKEVSSSLGAAIHYSRNVLGEITGISAAQWMANIERDEMGLEITRSLPGGIQIHREFTQGGILTAQSVSHRGNTIRSRHYRWDGSQRLKQIINNIDNQVTRFAYDEAGSLLWAQHEDGEYDYRMPDRVGNLFKSSDRKDRKYQAGGQLESTAEASFVYDEAGQLRSKRMHNGDYWQYQWYANGMLKQVIRPDGREVTFEYDPLGRRTAKIFGNKITRWVWDGDTILHEWSYPLAARPVTVVDADGNVTTPEEPVQACNTWIFEPDSFVPSALLKDGATYSIVTDHLGTPCEAFDDAGNSVWQCELDIYGKVRKFAGDKHFIPYRYQGQYEDAETGLYYNRFRYYSPDEGLYLSQDPIRLSGGMQLYGYVKNPNAFIDAFGLNGLAGLLTSENLKSLNLTDGSWRNVAFDGDQEGMLYVLKDSDTGEFLKVGKTERNTMVGRFEKYSTAGTKTGRNLTLDVLTIDKNSNFSIEAVEKQVRENFEKMGHQLPWDNTGGRLGRPGPGVPFTRLNSKLRAKWEWSKAGELVPKCRS